MVPNGGGSETAFTPSTGSNYQNVNEIPETGDSNYNQSATLNDTDTYAFGDLPSGTSIKAIQVNSIARKTSAGSRTFANVTRISGTDYPSSNFSALDTYSNYYNILEENPNTSSAWTTTDVNAAEFGITITD